MSVRITVLLEDGVDAQFTAFCRHHGFKKSTLIARLVREYLAAQVIQSVQDRNMQDLPWADIIGIQQNDKPD